MKTDYQKQNLGLAKSLSRKLSKLSHINTILLYGSISKGYSDAYSDVDLVIVYDLPHSKIRSQIKQIMNLFPEHTVLFKEKSIGVTEFDKYPSKKNSQQKEYVSYRAQIALKHSARETNVTIRLISHTVVKTLELDAKYDMYAYQTLTEYILSTTTLYQKNQSFTAWKKNMLSFSTFAPKLHRKFIDHCFEKIEYYLNGEIPDGVYRKDVVLTAYELSKCIVLIVNLLYAINDRCLPYPKWGHRDIAGLTIKPPRTQKLLSQAILEQNPLPLKKLMRELISFQKRRA